MSLLLRIGSVTAEIFLIRTNVARTNVAWQNVNMTVDSWNQFKMVLGKYLYSLIKIEPVTTNYSWVEVTL